MLSQVASHEEGSLRDHWQWRSLFAFPPFEVFFCADVSHPRRSVEARREREERAREGEGDGEGRQRDRDAPEPLDGCNANSSHPSDNPQPPTRYPERSPYSGVTLNVKRPDMNNYATLGVMLC